MSNRSHWKTYTSWRNMRQRVTHRVGYAHLDFDPRWNDFKLFLADMGERPEGMSLDRIDNTRGYWPDNCRWASDITQANNRKLRPSRSNTGVQGISYKQAQKRYTVEVMKDGERLYLGSRTTLEAAIELRQSLTRTEELVNE